MGNENCVQAFIWELDGTLLDSYEVIVSSLYKTYRDFNIELEADYIHKTVITKSVSAFISEMESRCGVPFEMIKDRYSEISDLEKTKIQPIYHAKEILEYLKEQGVRNFVFTHRGASTGEVLTKLGLIGYFEEIITGKDGFSRKPDPSAINYLVDKYHLNPDETFYVGDRTIDMDCAKNARIRGIMFLPEGSLAEATGREAYIVNDLLDIRMIVSSKIQ